MPVVRPRPARSSLRQLASLRRRDFLKAAVGAPVLGGTAALAQKPTPATFDWNFDGVAIAKSDDHAEDLVKFGLFDPELAHTIVDRVKTLLASGLLLELTREKLTRHTLDVVLRSERSPLEYRLRFAQTYAKSNLGLDQLPRVPYVDVRGEVDRPDGTPGGGVELPVALPRLWDGVVTSIVALEGRWFLDASVELSGVIYKRVLR